MYSWFLAVDADRSGQITANELQSALTNGNWSNFNSETCRLMIGMLYWYIICDRRVCCKVIDGVARSHSHLGSYFSA